MGKLYVVKEVAERWEVSERSLRDAIKKGELKASKLCGCWRIKEEDLQRYLESKSNIKAGG
jgi:excisionase family DNA binding protein